MVLSHSQDPSGNWSIVLGFISLVTRVLAPSICFIIVNVGSGPVLTAGEPLCEASAVPALRSEPAQSCCSADSAAPSLSPAPGRTLQEGGRKGDSVSYCICCCSCWNETQNTAGVFLMEQHEANVRWVFLYVTGTYGGSSTFYVPWLPPVVSTEEWEGFVFFERWDVFHPRRNLYGPDPDRVLGHPHRKLFTHSKSVCSPVDFQTLVALVTRINHPLIWYPSLGLVAASNARLWVEKNWTRDSLCDQRLFHMLLF